jgi:hypothetical protein
MIQFHHMTIDVAIQKTRERRARHRVRKALLEEKAWLGVKGIWKEHKLNPLHYQKVLRKEADRKVV